LTPKHFEQEGELPDYIVDAIVARYLELCPDLIVGDDHEEGRLALKYFVKHGFMMFWIPVDSKLIEKALSGIIMNGVFFEPHGESDDKKKMAWWGGGGTENSKNVVKYLMREECFQILFQTLARELGGGHIGGFFCTYYDHSAQLACERMKEKQKKKGGLTKGIIMGRRKDGKEVNVLLLHKFHLYDQEDVNIIYRSIPNSIYKLFDKSLVHC
jgi:hypothetical protein